MVDARRRILAFSKICTCSSPRSCCLLAAVAAVLVALGGLRLMPGFEVVIGDYTLVPNPFWGGALFPLVVLGVLVAWPWVVLVFVAGSADRATVAFGLDYETQMWVYRALVVVALFVVVRRFCRALQRDEVR